MGRDRECHVPEIWAVKPPNVEFQMTTREILFNQSPPHHHPHRWVALGDHHDWAQEEGQGRQIIGVRMKSLLWRRGKCQNPRLHSGNPSVQCNNIARALESLKYKLYTSVIPNRKINKQTRLYLTGAMRLHCTMWNTRMHSMSHFSLQCQMQPSLLFSHLNLSTIYCPYLSQQHLHHDFSQKASENDWSY